MELFTLLAKLALDTKEYDKEVRELEGQHIDAGDATIGLDRDNFDSEIADIPNTHVDDIEDKPKLELDSNDFNTGLTNAGENAEGFGSKISGLFSNIKGALVATGIVAAVTGVVAALKEGVELAKNHGDQIDKASQKMGISAKAYQEWSYALNLSGASIDDLNRGLRTWRQAAGDTDQMEKLGEAFGALGIDAEKAFAQIESGENLDRLLAQTLEALADYDGNRADLGEKLFGRNWTELEPLLNNTAAQLKEMRQEANDLGLVMTDEEVKNAAAYMDSTTRLELALNAIKESFASGIIPLLTDAANTTAKIVAFFNPRTHNGETISDMFADSDTEMQKSLATIEGTGDAAMEMVDKLMQMGEAEKLTAEEQERWRETAQWLIDKIPGLSEVIDTDTMSINANKEEITAVIAEWKKYYIERAKAKALQEKFQALEDKEAEYLAKRTEYRMRENERQAMESALVNIARQRYEEYMASDSYWQNIFRANNVADLTDADWAEGWANDKVWKVYQSLKPDSSLLGRKDEAWSQLLAEYEKFSEDYKLRDEVEKLKGELEIARQEFATFQQEVEKTASEMGESAGSATTEVEGLNTALDKLPSEKLIRLMIQGDDYPMLKQAKGDWTVPYDNYPSLLHRGEMVLTASQARKYRDGGEGMDYESVADMIAVAVDSAMNKVYVLMNGEKVGDLTSKRVNKNINASSYSRLRAMGG